MAAQSMDRTAIMAAILGAASALAGLLVVFEGFLITIYSGFDTATAKAPYKTAIWVVVAIVVLTMADVLGATSTLVWHDLFWATVWGFVAAVLFVMVGAVAVAKLALR